MRPQDFVCDNFFIQYNKGRCTRQPTGRHKIGSIPEQITTFLNLDNVKKYTGHCFRRTAATLLSESGANMQAIKQLGRWRSDIIAQGYVKHSIHNKQLIYDGITKQMAPTDLNHAATTSKKPMMALTNLNHEASTSKVVTKSKIDESNSFNLDWSDFSDDFNNENFDTSMDAGKKTIFALRNIINIVTLICYFQETMVIQILLLRITSKSCYQNHLVTSKKNIIISHLFKCVLINNQTRRENSIAKLRMYKIIIKALILF